MANKTRKAGKMEVIKKPQQLTFSDVEVVKKETVFKQFFKVDKFLLRHKKFDGSMTEAFDRLVFERGDAVVVLPFDPHTDEVILVEQIRIGAYANAVNNNEQSSPWLMECIAGMIDDGEPAEDVAIREAEEEAGIVVSGLKPMMSVYTSPGGTSERIHLFAAFVDSTTAGGIHGLEYENEDIRVHRVKFAEAVAMVEIGRINNAPTVLAIQWLQLNKTRWLESLDG